MKGLIRFIARQKLRFDIGQSFLSVLNLCFVVLAASDKISSWLHLPAKVIVPCIVPGTLFLVWLGGYILDKWKFQDAYLEEYNRRNAMLSEACKK